MQLKSQRQNAGPGLVGDKTRIYDSDGSQKDVSFINDISQVNIAAHDRSFNENLDERSKFVMSSSEINGGGH